MQKYCTKCGSKIDDKTGLCPNCDKQLKKKEIRVQKKLQRKFEKKNSKKEKWRKLPLKKKIKKVCMRFLIVILILGLLVGSGAVTLVYFNVANIPIVDKIFHIIGIDKNTYQTEDDITSSQNTVPHPDADEYFSENSTIVSEIEINNSNTILNEDEAYSFFYERGFIDYPIIAEYSMTGEYIGEIEILKDSLTKHPTYQTTYLSNTGDVWTILLMNNVVVAYPVSYNMQSKDNEEVVISEKETVISYDSVTNKFYETIPNSSQLIVKKTKYLNSEKLDQLTFEEIGAL